MQMKENVIKNKVILRSNFMAYFKTISLKQLTKTSTSTHNYNKDKNSKKKNAF